MSNPLASSLPLCTRCINDNDYRSNSENRLVPRACSQQLPILTCMFSRSPGVRSEFTSTINGRLAQSCEDRQRRNLSDAIT